MALQAEADVALLVHLVVVETDDRAVSATALRQVAEVAWRMRDAMMLADEDPASLLIRLAVRQERSGV